MSEPIIVALVTGLATAIPSVVATFVMNNAREAVQTERINVTNSKLDELARKIEQLADFDKRIAILEQKVNQIKEYRIINLEKGDTPND